MIEVKSKVLANGCKVVVSYDPCPQSPREWDNVGKVVVWDGCKYQFGDESMTRYEFEVMEQDKNLIWLPIYLYDHSGITINTTAYSCRWDSWQVGIIYCTKEKAVQEFGKKICTAKVREKALKCLEAEIKELDQYLCGEVYLVTVFDPQGKEIHSCAGYYGDADYCMSEGESFVKHCY